MADEPKVDPAVVAQIAELKKALETGLATNKEAVAKMASDLATAQIEAKTKELEAAFEKRQKDFVLESRKGRFGKNIKPVDMPVLLSKSAKDEATREAQKTNDNLYLLSKILDHASLMDAKVYQKLETKHSELRKAMDSITASEGLEWVPTDFSADMIDRVRLARKVAALFPQIDMPTDPYKMPALTVDSTAYLVAEQTAEDTANDARTFTASKPTTSNITLNAIKLGVRVNFSLELEEDSIIPVLETLKNNMAIEMVGGLEDAIINGDDAVTHQDANVTNASDRRKAFDGLRIAGQAANNTSLSTLNIANLRSLRAKMGKYGVDPSKLAWICSAKVYIKLQGLDEVTTLEKFGPGATILKGELGKLDGIPIIVSEYCGDDKDANGVNSATSNDQGFLLLVYVPGFVLGQRRRIVMKSFEDIQNDLVALVTSWRGTFMPIYVATSNNIVVEGVNIEV